MNEVCVQCSKEIICLQQMWRAATQTVTRVTSTFSNPLGDRRREEQLLARLEESPVYFRISYPHKGLSCITQNDLEGCKSSASVLSKDDGVEAL